ncbi:MAG: peptide ABC transporter substrate-binding protein [Tissierella sp.]|uniref:peptide ABC transporter substrate-binding protein n=1 Tax=Tissierella sp. TaxID=41274 RepID=UPI003F9BAE48
MKKVLSIILILTLLISGCVNKSSNKDASEEYRSVYSGEITTLNYLVTSSTNEFAVAANLIDTLVDYDKYGVIKPSLSTEWEVSEDKLTYTFKIREGVKWVKEDGSEYGEVTAKDFVDSLSYILDSKNESLTANIAYGVIKNAEKYYNGEVEDFEDVGVKAKDKYILEYTLEEPVPYFLSMLTYVCFFPVNGEFLEEVGEKFGTDNKNILYNGAYILEKFESQSKRILKKNEKYWDIDKVHIEKLVASYNKEAESLSPELFLRGEIDDASIPSTVLNEWMKDDKKEGLLRPNRTNNYSYFYALNFDPKFAEEYEPDNWKEAVNNINFRKSLFHSLDRKAAMLTTEPFEPEKRIHNTITPKDFVNIKGKDYTSFGSLEKIVDIDTFDKSKAIEFKEKAMEELDGKVKFPVKILMPYNTGVPEWANRAQVIQQQMGNLLGKDFIEIIIEAKPPTGFLKDVRRAGQFALLEVNWGPDYADPETFTDPFTREGTYNKPHLAINYIEENGRSKYENMLNLAKEEIVNIERRMLLFAEAEAFLINEAFIIPYGLGGGGYVASNLNPFEKLYSPYGLSSERFKGQKIMEEPMNTEEFEERLKIWEENREEALKYSK